MNDPITNAARLLREAAKEYANGVSINGVPDWANEPDTHAAFLEHIAAAEALESMSSKGLHKIAEPSHPTACTVEEVRAFEAASAPAAVAVPDERAAFEKWASFVGYSIKRWRDDANLYEDNATEDAWIAWEARAALAAAPAAPAGVAEPAPITFMTEDQALKFAWGKVREDVGTTGWTTGDSSNFYGFFMWGWKYRAQYELQRTAAPAAPQCKPAGSVYRNSVTGEFELMDYAGENHPLGSHVDIYTAAPAAPAGWKPVPVQVPDSAFPWVSGGYSADYRELDPRDQKNIEERAQRTWTAILDGIAAAPAAPAAPAMALPYEPTSDMLIAARECDPALPIETVRAIWWAMWRTASAAPVVLPKPDMWRDEKGLRGYTADPGHGPWYTAETVRALLAGVSTTAEQPYTDSTPQLHVGDSSFESWYSTYDPARKGDKQRARDAYAAGMGDPLVTAAPAPQAVLDYPWRDRLLDGRPLERDKSCFAEHPELPVLDEGMKPRAFFAALGIELKHTMAEDDLSIDEYDAISESEDWSAWTPRPPAGEAWKLIAIFDTEDGPAAWWARRGTKAAKE